MYREFQQEARWTFEPYAARCNVAEMLLSFGNEHKAEVKAILEKVLDADRPPASDWPHSMWVTAGCGSVSPVTTIPMFRYSRRFPSSIS